MGDEQASSGPTSGYQISVSPDRLSILLSIDEGARVDAAKIIAELRSMKVKAFDDGLVIEAVTEGAGDAVVVEVATGTPPVDATAEKFVFRVPVREESGCITRVQEGQVVATRLAGSAGSDGVDVFGNPLRHTAAPTPWAVGRNLTVSADSEILAAVGGNLRVENNQLSVEPFLEVRSDGSDPLRFDGDLAVRGGLYDGQSAEATGCLLVGGAVEAADLRAGRSIHVKGGVVGKSKGRVHCGGDLVCRFLSHVSVVAGGSVQALGEIVNCNVRVAGRVVVTQRPVSGGEISANLGVTCQVVGTPSHSPTLVIAGVDRTTEEEDAKAVAEIEANRAKVAAVRTKIEPLAKMMKRLTSDQRERATELMAEAADLEARTEELAATLVARVRVARSAAVEEVVVHDTAYAGVTIRFETCETTLQMPLAGPFVIKPKRVGSTTQVVLTDLNSNKSSILPSRSVPPSPATKLARGAIPAAASAAA